MDSINGIVRREIGDSKVAFRFSNLTRYLYLQKVREDGNQDTELTQFEISAYLLAAAIQAYTDQLTTKFEVFNLMDKMAEEDVISVLEEGGKYMDFVGKLALQIRAMYENSEEQQRILTQGLEMLRQEVRDRKETEATIAELEEKTRPE